MQETEGRVLAAAAQPSDFASADHVGAHDNDGGAVSKPDDMTIANAEEVDKMKEEMADVVEATVLSAQPETEKVPMKSPMGTEPEAKGVLMVQPNGRKGVLMVSGMPADSYQIWLMRDGHQVLVDRVVVNDDDGTGVQPIEMDESIFPVRAGGAATGRAARADQSAGRAVPDGADPAGASDAATVKCIGGMVRWLKPEWIRRNRSLLRVHDGMTGWTARSAGRGCTSAVARSRAATAGSRGIALIRSGVAGRSDERH